MLATVHPDVVAVSFYIAPGMMCAVTSIKNYWTTCIWSLYTEAVLHVTYMWDVTAHPRFVCAN